MLMPRADRLIFLDGTRTASIENRSRRDRDEWSSLEMASNPWTGVPDALRAIHGALRRNLDSSTLALLKAGACFDEIGRADK